VDCGSGWCIPALEDFRKCSGINWKIAWKVFFGWIITLVVGGTTGLLVAQGIYSPSEYISECGALLNNTN